MESRVRGVSQFLEVELMLDTIEDQEIRDTIELEAKADFLWEYSKNLNDFLDETFAEDGTLMSRVLPDEVVSVSSSDIGSSINKEIGKEGGNPLEEYIPKDFDNLTDKNKQFLAGMVAICGAIYYFKFMKKGGGGGANFFENNAFNQQMVPAAPAAPAAPV